MKNLIVKFPITTKDRLKYISELIKHFDESYFPISYGYSERSDMENKSLGILKWDNGKSLFKLWEDGNITFYYPITDNIEELLELGNVYSSVNMEGSLLREEQYFSNVKETFTKYNTNKWRQSRKVDLSDKRLTFRKIEKSDKPQLKKIYSLWNKYLGDINNDEYYKEFLNKLTADNIDYYGYATCYRNIPIMFRFGFDLDNCHPVDFECGLQRCYNKLNSKQFYSIIEEILKYRKDEVTLETLSLVRRKTKLENDRQLYKNRREWNKVKKILSEISDIDKQLTELKDNWHTKEIEDFTNILKYSLTNYNRYKYMEMLYNKGIEFYFEDSATDKLIEYKSKKNGYSKQYYVKWKTGDNNTVLNMIMDNISSETGINYNESSHFLNEYFNKEAN